MSEHRWGIVVVYRVSEEQVEHSVRELATIALAGLDVAEASGPGCIDCEQLYDVGRGTRCPGPQP